MAEHSRQQTVSPARPLRLLAVSLLAAFLSYTAGAQSYEVVRVDSHLLALTGKSGFLSFAGHRHAVIATDWQLQKSINRANLADSQVTITIPVSALEIDSPKALRLAEFDSAPSEDDIRKIQRKMLGPEVLDQDRFPEIEFRSTSVTAKGADQLEVTGQLRLHGESRRIQVPVRYQRAGDARLSFSGEFFIKQTDFGMEPESIAFGTVQVSDEVTIRFHVTLAPEE